MADYPLTAAISAVMRETARAEAAEAERDALRTQYAEIAHAVGICHEADGHACQPGPHETLLAQIRQNVADLSFERARAERYLAAIREWEGADDAHAKKAFARSYRADTRSRLEAAESALRAIVEDASRG